MQMWWCKQREECVSHRATGLRVRARETTTVRWFAGTKVSLVESAEASATAAFAPRFVEIPSNITIACGYGARPNKLYS
ncbi:hypothetical protein Fmac_001139 [Flemingia macrophylla]|uniref:Uncharacterized protein n=1 Tax=Flemingia macrophylla TaxID=520843 RepID=A0ABD1NGA1_9FABA